MSSGGGGGGGAGLSVTERGQTAEEMEDQCTDDTFALIPVPQAGSLHPVGLAEHRQAARRRIRTRHQRERDARFPRSITMATDSQPRAVCFPSTPNTVQEKVCRRVERATGKSAGVRLRVDASWH
ncbi:hypothetical protein EYF80_008207 [Liparis tanakae]|uniref:Uncharacterized protein n=1 Tax=Liparis tanakae TaxID=230148 RepID=A0A4Z2IU57_9TELE|nr:hypothetical protein EYF80_008207 [Liparis tanakae]